jgi:hypothetical protein
MASLIAVRIRVVLADHVQAAQAVQQAFPHPRANFIGLQDDIQQRSTLHRQGAVARP